MLPPAPGRFSTSTGWPKVLAISFASTRAYRSEKPPAGKGTMRRIAFVGYCCACAGSPSAMSVAPAAVRKVRRRNEKADRDMDFSVKKTSEGKFGQRHDPDAALFEGAPHA